MNNNEGKSERRQGQINIKNKTPLFTRNNFFILIIIIIIAVITGVLTTKYVDKTINSTVNNTMDSIKSDSITDNIIKSVGPSLVTIGPSIAGLNNIEVNPQNTTGVVISKEGLIVTNYSAIKDMKDIYVKLPAKGVKAQRALLLGYDKSTGIAVLKINSRNLTPVQYVSTANVKTGDTVLSIGNATNDNYVGMVTPGIVTSTNYSITIDGDRFSTIETSAVMNSQNYGGVLCNSTGKMIGFNSSYLTNKFNVKGLYFAVGTDALVNSVQKILDNSNVLGVEGAELENGSGFYISNVRVGSPAATSGLRATDIIVSIQGKKMENLDDFYKSVKELKKGRVANVEILRNGESEKINIKI